MMRTGDLKVLASPLFARVSPTTHGVMLISGLVNQGVGVGWEEFTSGSVNWPVRWYRWKAQLAVARFE